MQNPYDIVLVDMCGDLPEDFQDMRDRQKCYNRPLMKKRNEMGKSVCRVQKERGGPTRAPVRAGLLSQGQKGQSYQG
jgi:hypothetical protein